MQSNAVRVCSTHDLWCSDDNSWDWLRTLTFGVSLQLTSHAALWKAAAWQQDCRPLTTDDIIFRDYALAEQPALCHPVKSASAISYVLQVPQQIS